MRPRLKVVRPAEWPDPRWYEPDIDCPTCEDNPDGIRVGEWGTWMPCPDCPGPDAHEDWTKWHELLDDMERGK